MNERNSLKTKRLMRKTPPRKRGKQPLSAWESTLRGTINLPESMFNDALKRAAECGFIAPPDKNRKRAKKKPNLSAYLRMLVEADLAQAS